MHETDQRPPHQQKSRITRATVYKRRKRWIEITNSITILAEDMVLPNTVEKELQEDDQDDPRYVTLSGNTPAKQKSSTCTDSTELETVQHFSAVTDMRSSRSMDPYRSLTDHVISDDRVL